MRVYWLVLLILTILAWGTNATAAIDFSVIPEDGVLNSDPNVGGNTLTFKFSADTAGTLKAVSNGFISGITDRTLAYETAGTNATMVLTHDLFVVGPAKTLTFSFYPQGSTGTTGTTVHSMKVLIDGIAPSTPASQKVLAANQTLLVSWSIAEYSNDTSAGLDAQTNVEAFRIIYAQKPLASVLNVTATSDATLVQLHGAQPESVVIIQTGFTDNKTIEGLANDTTYYVVVEAIDHADNASGLKVNANGNIIAAVAVPIEVLSFSEANGFDDRCFIASAAFGSPQSAWVDAYRFFRDRFLLKIPGGKWLIERYYQWSPTAALWLDDHAGARGLVRLILAVFAPVAVVLGGVGPLAILALLAWPLRRRWRQVAPTFAIAALCLLMPQRGNASDSEWKWEQSASLLTGPYYPSRAGDNSTTPYHSAYGDQGTYLILGDYTWYPLTIGGKLGIGGRFGFGRDKGNSIVASTAAASAESSKFWFLPAAVILRYRGEWIDNQPLVPAVQAGVNGWGLHEKRRTQNKGTQNFVLGWHAGGELELSVNWIEPEAAARMLDNYGIRNTIFYGGYEYVKLDDFGKPKTTDFSHHNWTAGLRFVF